MTLLTLFQPNDGGSPPAPTVISATPSTGTTLGGTVVSIAGTGFTGASIVTFGGTAAASFSVLDAATISATTPAHAAGVVDVVVTTGSGSGTGTGIFTYEVIVVEQFYPGAGGGYPVRGRAAKAEEWKKRRKQLEELDAIISRAMGEIPSDVPEAKAVKAAAQKVEKAADAQPAKPPGFFGSLPPFDLQGLIEAVTTAQKAIEDYKARKLEEMREQDDEEILLLLDED